MVTMAGHKLQRTCEDIKRELTSILRIMKDPRVKDKFITIVRADVSNDFSQCKVYVSSMEGIETAKNAVKGLKAGEGFIRTELGKRLSIRRVPAFVFLATDSIEYSANISRILNELDIKGDTDDNNDID